MGFRDRFFTPATARAILSWRIAVGIGVGVVTAVAGVAVGAAVLAGAAVYAALVLAAMPRGPKRPAIDPFGLGEPWRRIVQDAQRSSRTLRATVAGASDGPLADSLREVADQLERGLAEAWEIARGGDAIDASVRRLDPTALRSRLTTLREQAAAAPSVDTDAAIGSVERQLASADRLRQRSEETAAALRLHQVRLDELVARANEVTVGTVDTQAYARDVDDLVIRLEALHQAVEEIQER